MTCPPCRPPRGLLVAGGLLALAACAPPSSEPMEPEPTPVDTHTLTVALQDGFEDAAVVVRVDGDDVLREDAVTTDVRIGLARSVEVSVGALPATVEVDLPRAGVSGATTVEAGALYLGVSVRDGAVVFRRSSEPFGYL